MVVIPHPDLPHNHPSHPSDKLSLVAADYYIQCALAYRKRALGATVSAVDKGNEHF
jgi:hypothetical protein